MGDIVKVVFKNKATRNYSFHPHSLKFTKEFEGMHYNDDTPKSTGDSVSPGQTFTYFFKVPDSAGPAPDGSNCIGSLYVSGVDFYGDQHAGLAGPIFICKPGIYGPDYKRKDSVDKEFALLFMAYNENRSPYIHENAKPGTDFEDPDYMESNMYDVINGLAYGNFFFEMCLNDNVFLYIFGTGGPEDIHTAHFHGNDIKQRKKKVHLLDVLDVFPGTSVTGEMTAANEGTWIIHCHVEEHVKDGMFGFYKVRKCPHGH